MRDDWNSSEFATDLLMRGAARRKRESLLDRACAGLTLPENVPSGALRHLAETAMSAWRELEAMSRHLKATDPDIAFIAGREATRLKTDLVALGAFGDNPTSFSAEGAPNAQSSVTSALRAESNDPTPSRG